MLSHIAVIRPTGLVDWTFGDAEPVTLLWLVVGLSLAIGNVITSEQEQVQEWDFAEYSRWVFLLRVQFSLSASSTASLLHVILVSKAADCTRYPWISCWFWLNTHSRCYTSRRWAVGKSRISIYLRWRYKKWTRQRSPDCANRSCSGYSHPSLCGW